jgi:hypothetical protein
MKMLATTYGALGRREESLALKGQTLEFELRVLPANHPHIGDTLAPARGSFMLTHGQAAGKGLDLNKKAVEFLQRVLPPNHPTVGKSDAAHFLRTRLRCNVWRAARCMVMVP